ncbi:MAG TPA: hypothetical protein VJH22_04870 [Candidatus Nanoarchaeia archaeon]|nr:hypothetical protein [Candidatus Nanoarchaeia archaeon]
MQQEKTPLNILVVEDNESHLADAQAYFSPLQEKGILHVEYATTLFDAQSKLSKLIIPGGKLKKKDGILTDIFFPLGGSPQYQDSRLRTIESLFRAAVNVHWDDSKDDESKSREKERASLLKAAEPWLNTQYPPPSGMYLVLQARSERIPLVVHTDVSGHGKMGLPSLLFMDDYHLPVIVIPEDSRPPQKNKDWKKIHSSLTTILGDPDYRQYPIKIRH